MAFTFAGRFGPTALIDNSNTLLKSTPYEVFLPGASTHATLYRSRSKQYAFTGNLSSDAFGNTTFFAEYREDGYDLKPPGQEPVRVYVDEPPADTVNLSDVGVLVPAPERPRQT